MASPELPIVPQDLAYHDDAASETSTIRYSHEAFDTFQDKVISTVATQLMLDESEVQVTRMKGGSYNRVIGVDITPKAKKSSFDWLKMFCTRRKQKHPSTKTDSYVVRIPRHDGEDMDNDIAILRAVATHVSLPTPEVTFFDLSHGNMLEKPYMIQKKLEGQNLAQLWQHLNMAQKKCVAKLVTKLVPIIARVEAPPGAISLSATSNIANGGIEVEKFCVPARGLEDEAWGRANTWCAQPQTALDHLLEQCERWREYQTSQGVCFDHIWDGFATIAQALNVRGFLGGPCVLTHGDLKAYNMLAEIQNESEISITGVIDWDYAVVAPEFMAYRAPFWLWTPEDMNSADDDDEDNVSLPPITDEDRELKNVFLSNACEKYKRLAFAPEALLARRMYPILQKGVFGPWNMQEANNVLREWSELHPEDGIMLEDNDFDVSSIDELE